MARNAERLAGLMPYGIDINFGCPARIVNQHGGGAALLDTPKTVETVVASVRKAVPEEMLVSAKMRRGVADDRRAEDCARAIEAGGAGQLVVHARTKSQGYQPPAYWHRIRDIRNAVCIPVIANGEIWSVEDAQRCVEASGCTDLMLGRGMVANPGLATAIRASGILGDKTGKDPATCLDFRWTHVVGAVVDFWTRHAGMVSVTARAGRLKQWLVFLKRRFPEANAIFERIRNSNDEETISAALERSLDPL
jgi:tRNA-dihydrouridine synthase C